MRLARLLLAAAPIALLAACSSSPDDSAESGGAAASGVADRLRRLGAAPCADNAEFQCLKLRVPLDHVAPGGKSIEVAFAVHPAPAATRKGMLVRVSGGPGYSGLDDLDDLREIDARLPREFDIVRFDLRGVKRSGNLECKAAAGRFYEGGLRVASAADEVRQVAKARDFARDCVAEMGIPAADVPFYNTDQATDDLEAFRKALGEEKLTLYGLSYGTQYTQTYTKKYPSRVRALVIDGVVDLTLDHVGYMKNLNGGIAALLDLTFDDCARRAACAAGFADAPGGSPKAKIYAAYDALAAELDRGPKKLAWKRTDGTTSERTYSRAAFDTTTFNSLGYPESRRDLLAALAAAYKTTDFMPLQKLAYESAGVDPDTAPPAGTAGADPDMSDAIYYAFTCNDYGNDAESEQARVDHYLAGGRSLWPVESRLLAPYYGDLPCMVWPVTKKAQATPALPQTGVPVMVLGATGDGATPVNQGDATFRRLADGYQVTVDGGSHVMWGGGNACADGAVTPFLLDLARPASRESRCADTLVAAEEAPSEVCRAEGEGCQIDADCCAGLACNGRDLCTR